MLKESIKKAVALEYKPEENRAPKVIAKGKGVVAENIIKIAQNYEVPLYEDPDLVESLIQLEIDFEVPPDLYKAVAEVIAYIYSLKK